MSPDEYLSPNIHQHHNSNGNTTTQKRIRATGEALEFLINEFEKNPNPTPEHRKYISEKSMMNEKAVRIWFQNRRAKQRKFERQQLKQQSGSITSTTTTTNDFGSLRLPIELNDKYCFINCSSLSVGSWQRIKTGFHNELLLKSQLINLSPFIINKVMENVDLLIILSKRNNELNYFFSAISNNSKILFRIFYPLNSISKCSIFKNNYPPSTNNNMDDNSSEIRLNLCFQPRFSVYFFNDSNNATPNQWSICDDFSEGQQVSQAYTKIDLENSIAIDSIPHVLVGSTENLQYLSQFIMQYQQNQQQQLQLQQQPSVSIPTNTINTNQLDLQFNDITPNNNNNNNDLQSIFDQSIATPSTFTPQQFQSIPTHNNNSNSTSTITTGNTNFNESPFSMTSANNQFYESEISNSPQSLKKFTSNNNNNDSLFAGITRFNTTETSPVEDILFSDNIIFENNESYTHVKSTSMEGTITDTLTFTNNNMNTVTNNNNNNNIDEFSNFGDFEEFGGNNNNNNNNNGNGNGSNGHNLDSFIDFGN
ncbi:PHO2 Regulatory protein PHO2 [Candida maltosa Xu316]